MASRPYPDFKRCVWVMKYRPDPTGRWEKVTLGKDPRLGSARPPKTPPQWIEDRALEFREIEYRARHGLAKAPARARSLESYVLAYMDAYRAGHDAGSVKQLVRHATRFLDFCQCEGVASLQAVTRQVCRDYLEHRIGNVSHNTLRTEMRYLSPIWSRAVEDGLVAANPWSKQKVPGKPTEREPTFWTGEEVGRIAEACGKPWQRDLVLILANTGLRISTALAMRWSWIDWARSTITIPAESGEDDIKTSYALVMNRMARDILTRRHAVEGREIVFAHPLRGGQIGYETARAAIERAVKKAGVRHGLAHDFRHTYARALLEGGVPINAVQAQLGHSTVLMTMRYLKVKAQHAQASLEEFALGGG